MPSSSENSRRHSWDGSAKSSMVRTRLSISDSSRFFRTLLSFPAFAEARVSFMLPNSGYPACGARLFDPTWAFMVLRQSGRHRSRLIHGGRDGHGLALEG